MLVAVIERPRQSGKASDLQKVQSLPGVIAADHGAGLTDLSDGHWLLRPMLHRLPTQ